MFLMYSPLTKEIIEIDGNWVNYKININPDKFQLNNGNLMDLEDTFSDNQSIDYSTISITADPSSNVVSYDYSNNTGTFPSGDRRFIVLLSFRG